jgi:N-acetylmuramoyl-L-alanine amidase
MGLFGLSRGGAARGLCCVGVVWVSVGLSGAAATAMASPATKARPKRVVVLTPWEQAVKARGEFEAQAAGTHTKASYGRVMDGYRAIYHDAPRDAHAAEAVNAVAELLAEQGRELGDAASLRNAVGQYEFLRTQYPGSGLRAGALLEEGRIEGNDLKDAGAARERYAALVKEAPRSKAAGEARVELGELGAGKVVPPTHRDDAAMNGAPGSLESQKKAKGEPAVRGLALTEENARAVEGVRKQAQATVVVPTADPSAALRDDKKVESVAAPVAEVAVAAPVEVRRAAVRSGALAQVTGIRHWSTATYTRVAIDLGDEVTFEAARVPNPDRIYFDLHGAKLGAELVGKSFSVTDDGFLKRIRAAQESGDVTRVVLDVNDVTEYSAFLLPNPYRLIIDIHGAIHGAKGAPSSIASTTLPAETVAVTPADSGRANAAANSSGLPAMAPTDGGEAVRPVIGTGSGSGLSENGRTLSDAHLSRDETASKMGHPSAVVVVRPVPGAVAVTAPARDVAAVSEAPGRVEATSAPTSKPIASLVPTAKEVNLGAGNPGTGNSGTGRKKKAAKSADASVVADAAPAKAADKTADGETSMVRALGLKIGRIVIDAGHGGHDSGTIGVDGIEEKDVVLDVALRVGKLLHDRLGAEIIYTRSDDTFIPLETRTAIANKAQADLFLSIHANSSQDESARGVETYYLNFTSDPAALDVAARENAVGGQSIHQLSDLVKKIALKDKIAESREFAADVEGSLYGGLAKGNDGLKNRGVKKAPFVVLIGANMPSILAEISFVTNAKDASQLREPEYRERVAESLYAGVAKYENGLAGVRSPAPVVRASVR